MEYPTLVWAVADSRRCGSPQRVRSGVAALLEGDSRCELANGWRAIDSHDPRHGHINPFITAVVERYAANIVRRQRAAKRDPRRVMSLHIMVNVAEQGSTELAQLVTDHEHHERLGRRRRSDLELTDLAADLATVIARLSTEDQRLVGLLWENSVTAAADELGAPRTTVQQRIRRIRKQFVDAGLQDYL